MSKKSHKLSEESVNQKASQAPSHRRWPVKISVIGDVSVGKSSVINRYIYDRFDECVNSTIGGIAFNKSMTYIDCTFDWHIWDISGGLTFRNMIPNYFRGSEVFILMFDITKRESFENIRDWLAQVRRTVSTPAEKLVFIICANKKDLKDERAVSEIEAKSLAKELNANYIETSAKLSSGIVEMFRIIARGLRNIKTKEVQSDEDPNVISLNNQDPETRTNRTSFQCC